MKIEIDEQCPDCGGTGLYIGMAERDGAAVVCYKCKGAGKFHFVHEYEEFTGRKTREGVKRVFAANPGIVIGEREGVCYLSGFGGMPYEDWIAGLPFPRNSEMRKYTCPSWFYQTADYSKNPKWDECYESLGYTFSNCPHFTKKENCWLRWDKEFGGQK